MEQIVIEDSQERESYWGGVTNFYSATDTPSTSSATRDANHCYYNHTLSHTALEI